MNLARLRRDAGHRPPVAVSVDDHGGDIVFCAGSSASVTSWSADRWGSTSDANTALSSSGDSWPELRACCNSVRDLDQLREVHGPPSGGLVIARPSGTTAQPIDVAIAPRDVKQSTRMRLSEWVDEPERSVVLR
jgi:hypothetical protein